MILAGWVAAAVPLAAQPSFEPSGGDSSMTIHDPSTICAEEGRFYIFGTGAGLRARTATNLQDWVVAPKVFAKSWSWTTNAVPGFRGHFWAPDVIRVGDRWLLYYSVSTFGQQTSAIGLATNPTLDAGAANYAWSDAGPVIQSRPGDEFNTIDPSVMLDAEGRLWMAFGSYWRGIYLIELDPKTGRRRDASVPPRQLAWNDSIEAACLTRHGEDYFLFVNWGQCCRGTNSTYEVRVGRSKAVTGPYLDRDGKDLVEGGGTPFLATSGRIIGPGHVGVFSERGTNWFSFHFYDATNRGRPHLGLRELRWTTDGWPRDTGPSAR